MIKEKLQRRLNIIAILENQKTGKKQKIECHNIVTNDGDKYYAQKGAGETPTGALVFTTIYLGSTGTPSTGKASNYGSITPITNGSVAKAAGYPKTNDTDTDNTGAGVDIVTWQFNFPTTYNLAGITEAVIAQTGASGTDPVLTHFAFGGAFTKDTSTTLKVIVNHEASGQ